MSDYQAMLDSIDDAMALLRKAYSRAIEAKHSEGWPIADGYNPKGEEAVNYVRRALVVLDEVAP